MLCSKISQWQILFEFFVILTHFTMVNITKGIAQNRVVVQLSRKYLKNRFVYFWHTYLHDADLPDSVCDFLVKFIPRL